MAIEKVTLMVLKVDLQCPRCCEEIKKILYKFARRPVYDEKANTVTITVVYCCPEEIRKKLLKKGGKVIKRIEIKEPEKPNEPEKKKAGIPNEAEKRKEKRKEKLKEDERRKDKPNPKEDEKRKEKAKPREDERRKDKPKEDEKRKEKPKEDEKRREEKPKAHGKGDKPEGNRATPAGKPNVQLDIRLRINLGS